MARSSTRSKRSKKTKVDLSGVESGGRSCPDGQYRFKVIESEKTESSEGNEMFKVKLKGLTGKAKNVTVYDNLSLLPQALWKLKGFLESAGAEADGVVEIDPADFIDEEVTATIINEKYEGRDRPKVAEYNAGGGKDDEDEDEDEEESEDEDDEESDDEEEEEEEEDEEESEEEDDEEESDEEDEDSEDEDEDEDEDEEEDEDEDEDEEKPKRGKAGKFKVGAKVKFKDEKNKTVSGVVMSVDGKTLTIEDKKGSEWEVDQSEVSAA